ncbi:hypothetical protein M8494_37465 [Serratia ureilytica]
MIVQENNGFTPTPAVSHAILCYNAAAVRRPTGIVLRRPTTRRKTAASIQSRRTALADTNLTSVIEARQRTAVPGG